MSTDIAMGEAFDQAVNDLDNLINRRFAASRAIRLEPEDDRWIVVIDQDTVLWRGWDMTMAMGWMKAFLARPENASVRIVGAADWLGHSVRVPDNVVPIGGR